MTLKCIVSQRENKAISSKDIDQNPFSKDCVVLTATGKDMGASYNRVVKEHSLDSIDGWIIFCKANFAFCEDLDFKMDKLKINCIYGPSGFKRKLRKLHKGIIRVGRFFQSNNNNVFKKVGKTVLFPTKVLYLDHNCFIIHSAIIKKYNISFPEGLEDNEMLKVFCRNLKKNSIRSKVIPISCYKLISFNAGHHAKNTNK